MIRTTLRRPTPLIAASLALLLVSGCAATREAADDAGEAIDETAENIADTELWQNISSNWAEFKDAAAEQWQALTADDIDDIGGNRESLIEEVSEAYDMTRDEAAEQVDEWADALES